MVVGITHTMGSEHKWQKYLDWLHRCDSSIECVTLSYKLDNLSAAENCNAFILTGGHDVDPVLYGGSAHHPKINDVDRRRDDFERNVLDVAFQSKTPTLGICRGLQLANVHFGGTLIPDIEDAGFPSHRSEKDFECRHDLTVEKESMLSAIVECHQGNINSSHHQAVDALGNGLRVVARSGDGIVEAIELEHKTNNPFFLLVQWHPERMNDFVNPFSQKILQRFLVAAQQKEEQA